MSDEISIRSATDGVCLLCGDEGQVFEATTPCGRLTNLPVCAKDLFALVGARHRDAAAGARGPTRGRGKSVTKARTGTEDNPTRGESVCESGHTGINTCTTA